MKSKVKKTAASAPEFLRILWQEGFFANSRTQEEILDHLAKRGINFSSNTLRMALTRASHLFRKKHNGVTKYIQRRPAVSKEVDRIENDLFEDGLIEKFGKTFEAEMADLKLNFGMSGSCTAFLLRKILEKLIYITFAKNQMESKLENPGAASRLIGLEAMIDTAAREKVNGMPFLTPRTAQEIRGIKFLGDASAHNPLTNVDMKTIIPQMPFIITAYKELLR